MAGETVSAAEFFSEPIQSGPSKKPEAGKSVSADEFFGEAQPVSAVPSIPDEHRGRFIQEFGQALYEGMGYSAKRFYAGVGAGAASINNVIGYITGLNSFQRYRDFVQGGFEYQQQVKAERPDAMGFERIYYGFVDGLGAIAPTLPIDVMTGGATKVSLAGRILPKMEAMLARVPNFVLGMGWRGMVNGIESSDDGLVNQVAGGIVGVGESMASGLLYANAGLGFLGIGKMAGIGLAESFYNAAKEGRLPTSQEMIDASTQAAMMGAVFTVLPHLVEGSQVVAEKAAFGRYAKRYQTLVTSSKGVKSIDIPKGQEALYAEARKYKSAEEFVQSQTVFVEPQEAKLSSMEKPYAIRKSKNIGGESLFHETSSGSAYGLITASQEASGLNVSNDVHFALGQKGKGIVIEFDKNKVFGDRGFARIIKKPATDVVGEKEFELAQGTNISPNKIKSVTVKENAQVEPKLQRYLDKFFSPITQADNSVKYIPNKQATQLTDIWNKVQVDFQIDPQEAKKLVSDLFSDEHIRPVTKSALLEPWREELRRQGAIMPYEFQLAQWKDPAKLGMLRERTDRIIENVAKGEAVQVKAVSTDFVDLGNNYMARWESEINRTIQDRLFLPKGIRPRSKLDAAVMRYGEKRVDLESLKAQFPDKWQDIKAASDWCRSVYEETIDFLNDQRRANGRELINKRDDYFRHTQEIRTAAMLFGHTWFDMNNEPTSIAGIVNKAKYGAPFNPTIMERLGGKFQESAILAMQDYVRSVAPEIFHTETVRRIRALEQHIRAQALVNETELKEGKAVAKIDLSNFVTRLSEDARIISGAPSSLTQWFNEHAKSDHWFDRFTVGTIRYIMKNSTTNMIAGNLSAALMNILPVDQQVITTDPRYIAKGHTIAGLHFDRDAPLVLEGATSNFYDRRFPRGSLAKNWYETLVDKGYVPANRIDRHMVMALISGKFYEQFEKHGKTAQEAMDIADKYADRVVQDRSYGKVPPVMSEQELQLFNRFQVEINNLWSWLSQDLGQAAKGSVKGYLGRLAAFAIIANVTNTLYEKILGRRPQLDFIEIFGNIGQAVLKQNPEYLTMAGKALLGNVPFGNLVVPGGRVPAASVLPDVFEITDNPEKWFSEMCKPFVYGNPLGYGAQVKKTIEGVKAWTDGGVYTPAGNIRYSVQRSFTNFMRGFLFGKNAFPEAVKYWSEPKSER